MPRVIEKIVYEFDELSNEAKQSARQAFVEQPDYPYDDWWFFDEFVACAELLGIEIDSRKNGAQIHFELHVQGAGASFTGKYRLKSDAVQAITAHAPEDKELHALAERLTALQMIAALEHNDQLEADITLSGRSSHSAAMKIDVAYTGHDVYTDDLDVEQHIEEELTSVLRDFADWMYCQLLEQYGWHFSNEHVDECLQDTEFDEFGTII